MSKNNTERRLAVSGIASANVIDDFKRLLTVDKAVLCYFISFLYHLGLSDHRQHSVMQYRKIIFSKYIGQLTEMKKVEKMEPGKERNQYCLGIWK